ncbi:MAG: glycerol dehydrogenase [Rhizomicrobium sp.]
MSATTIFPNRYVQGDGALKLLPDEIARLGNAALAIIDRVVLTKVAPQIKTEKNVTITIEAFGGECSDEEIERLSAAARKAMVTVVVGIGGGKVLDTAKAVGHTLGLPVVVAPTVASTDAPCSALSVIYTPEGGFSRYLFLQRNPDVVLVDTAMIVAAPARLLVSGMGDALSTWFEAEDCQKSGSPNMTGRPGSMTAYALARLCYDTLIGYGAEALKACEAKAVTPALERIVEANTLLSGIGFESGGLSGAHAIHNGLTALAGTHHFFHGEKVAFGTLSLLYLSCRPQSVIDEVFGFCASIGLPTTLADIGLEGVSDADLLTAAKIACAPEDTILHVNADVTPEMVVAAMRAADAEGRRRKAA